MFNWLTNKTLREQIEEPERKQAKHEYDISNYLVCVSRGLHKMRICGHSSCKESVQYGDHNNPYIRFKCLSCEMEYGVLESNMTQQENQQWETIKTNS